MQVQVLLSMRDAAFPLYVISFLLGHDSEHLRLVGARAILDAALDTARYVEQMKHLQTCRECQAKAKMRDYLANLAKGRS